MRALLAYSDVAGVQICTVMPSSEATPSLNLDIQMVLTLEVGQPLVEQGQLPTPIVST